MRDTEKTNPTLSVSQELRVWLDKRARHCAIVQLARADGACILSRDETVDPRCLTEPLRSEAINRLRQTEKAWM